MSKRVRQQAGIQQCSSCGFSTILSHVCRGEGGCISRICTTCYGTSKPCQDCSKEGPDEYESSKAIEDTFFSENAKARAKRNKKDMAKSRPVNNKVANNRKRSQSEMIVVENGESNLTASHNIGTNLDEVLKTNVQANVPTAELHTATLNINPVVTNDGTINKGGIIDEVINGEIISEFISSKKKNIEPELVLNYDDVNNFLKSLPNAKVMSEEEYVASRARIHRNFFIGYPPVERMRYLSIGDGETSGCRMFLAPAKKIQLSWNKSKEDEFLTEEQFSSLLKFDFLWSSCQRNKNSFYLTRVPVEVDDTLDNFDDVDETVIPLSVVGKVHENIKIGDTATDRLLVVDESVVDDNNTSAYENLFVSNDVDESGNSFNEAVDVDVDEETMKINLVDETSIANQDPEVEIISDQLEQSTSVDDVIRQLENLYLKPRQNKNVIVIVGGLKKCLVPFHYPLENISQPKNVRSKFFFYDMDYVGKAAYQLFRYECLGAFVCDFERCIRREKSEKRWYSAMCQLEHETEGFRYCLLDPLMTLCHEHLVHFLIYDKQKNLAERCFDEKEFKTSFKCRQDVVLSRDMLEKMTQARNIFLFNYNLFFNITRGIPRDSKQPETGEKGTLSEEKILARNVFWNVHLGTQAHPMVKPSTEPVVRRQRSLTADKRLVNEHYGLKQKLPKKQKTSKRIMPIVIPSQKRIDPPSETRKLSPARVYEKRLTSSLQQICDSVSTGYANHSRNVSVVQPVDSQTISTIVTSATKPVVELMDKMSERFMSLHEKILANDLEKHRADVQAKVETNREIQLNIECKKREDEVKNNKALAVEMDLLNRKQAHDDLAATREYELKLLKLQYKLGKKIAYE